MCKVVSCHFWSVRENWTLQLRACTVEQSLLSWIPHMHIHWFTLLILQVFLVTFYLSDILLGAGYTGVKKDIISNPTGSCSLVNFQLPLKQKRWQFVHQRKVWDHGLLLNFFWAAFISFWIFNFKTKLISDWTYFSW